jgi:hypothetical protein
MWLGNNTKEMLIVYFRLKNTANAEREIVVQRDKISSVK